MIHTITIITCDKCNPEGETRATPENEGKGIFNGPIDAAEEAGWVRIYAKGKLEICPECQEDN